MDWLWPAAEKAGNTHRDNGVAVPPLFGQIAERHPNLKLIIGSPGRDPRGTDDAAFVNLAPLVGREISGMWP